MRREGTTGGLYWRMEENPEVTPNVTSNILNLKTSMPLASLKKKPWCPVTEEVPGKTHLEISAIETHLKFSESSRLKITRKHTNKCTFKT